MFHFPAFFARALGDGHTPYHYQTTLAGEDQGAPCTSQLIDIPTGLGKTAAVVLAWLWNRVVLQRDDWPRRLVYCLPMRTLVEQTEEEVRKWVGNLLKDTSGLSEAAIADLQWLRDHSPIILMGGEELDGGRKEWDLHPEKPAILIGTQDMLLSRALNRGYGMSRYRWPMHFGLLNNDCLWVMDETQLMGVGVETSAQLDGFRHSPTMLTNGSCPTWWMSATLSGDRLGTVDHPIPQAGWPVIRLSDDECSNGRPYELINAAKNVFRAPFSLTKKNKKEYASEFAKFIKEKHFEGALTLVVVNTVARAQEIHAALASSKKKGQSPIYDPARVGLVHSRFRRKDREKGEQLMHSDGDRIIIATPAVEAGVDVSARLVISELAPWSSMVQRFGRCNRRAEYKDAEIHWVDIECEGDKDDSARPYQAGELDEARKVMDKLEDAAPIKLFGVEVPERKVVRPVIRRRDLIDLFDTTPDICGQDIDISRYIRDGNDTDVLFYWRAVADDGPTSEERVPARDELCRVSIGAAAGFLKKAKLVWRWDHVEKRWMEADKPLPGATYLLGVNAGGYSDVLGWTGDAKDRPMPVEDAETSKHEANEDDKGTFNRQWEELVMHTEKVANETAAILSALSINGQYEAVLTNAAWWHDLGKLHPAFVALMQENGQPKPGGPWAKSPHNTRQGERRGFRHELASALAWLLAAPADATERDLTAYLIAAHHGKVRLSIRSLPNEKEADNCKLFARGVWDGDELPAITIGPHTIPATKLDLSFMRMGEGTHGPSWLARTTALRDRLGPFRLAYLETLLRAADARASNNA